ncbi:MAG: hypothetical protein AAGJ93_05245 [Bacteroidota bacterium]
MQDDSTYNYDPALVDRGWSMLEQQLDEVLPQKTKRRFPWFWLVLLLGFCSLAGAGWYVTINSNEEGEKSQKSYRSAEINKPIARGITQAKEQDSQVVSGVVDNTSDDQTVSIAPTTPSNDNILSRDKANYDRPIAATATDVILSSAITQPSTQVEESTLDIKEPNDDSSSEEINLALSIAPVEQTIEETAVTDAAELVVHQTRQIDVTPRLEPTDLLFLVEETKVLPLASTKPIRKNIPSWRYFVEGQATIALGPQPGFLGGIVGVERKIGRSWNLGLELGYERSQQNLTSSEFSENLGISADQSPFIEPVGSGTFFDNTYNLEQSYGAVSYDRFKSNLMVHYKLSPRWRVGTGMSLIFYRQALFDFTEVNRGINQGAESEPNAIGSPSNLFEDLVNVYEYDENRNTTVGPYPLAPNRWQLAGRLTAQYQLHRNWGVNFTYRHDLTAWQSGTEFGTPSNLQLGLRYYIR